MHPFAPTQPTHCYRLLQVVYYVAIHTLPILLFYYTVLQKNKFNQFYKVMIDQVYDEAQGYPPNNDKHSHPKPSEQHVVRHVLGCLHLLSQFLIHLNPKITQIHLSRAHAKDINSQRVR